MQCVVQAITWKTPFWGCPAAVSDLFHMSPFVQTTSAQSRARALQEIVISSCEVEEILDYDTRASLQRHAPALVRVSTFSCSRPGPGGRRTGRHRSALTQPCVRRRPRRAPRHRITYNKGRERSRSRSPVRRVARRLSRAGPRHDRISVLPPTLD